MKNIFKILSILSIILILSSCGTSNYYKGCDGKKKFKTQMW